MDEVLSSKKKKGENHENSHEDTVLEGLCSRNIFSNSDYIGKYDRLENHITSLQDGTYKFQNLYNAGRRC